MIGRLGLHFPKQTLADPDVLGVYCPGLLLDTRVVEVLVRVEVDVNHVDQTILGVLR